jgi:DinB superfamily
MFPSMSTLSAPPAADARYPIGKFRRDEADLANHAASIATLAALPANLRTAIHGLSDAQLDTPYRDGGWTVRQLVHHLADSHMNAYVRVRLALTEDWPTVKAYDEKLWAELPDARTAPVEHSLALLEGLHARFVSLLNSLTDEQWKCGYDHTENGRTRLAEFVALYDWHCRHHVAHIVELRKRNGW